MTMRILLSGYHNPHYWTVTEYIERAIRALGHELAVFDDGTRCIPGRLRDRSPGMERGTYTWDPGTGAFAATAVLRLFNRVPDDLRLADTTMGEALTELGPGSLIVAAVAGVAGMMAFERPGGAAVGVAISVTTIPAAAYVGAAMAMGRDDPMWGALAVLVAEGGENLGHGAPASRDGAAVVFSHVDDLSYVVL